MTPAPKIMCVEDDPDILLLAQMALQSVGGFEVVGYESGAEALAAAQVARPDLILLDVMMPGMTGPETLAALRGLPGLADVPVVFMTARVQPQEVGEYKQLGAVEVISKPFDPMTLSDLVSQIWRRLAV